MAESETVAVIRIELEDVEPLIWRRAAVPASITLKGLHDVIQAAMGWFNCHMWEFSVGDRIYGMPFPDDEDWGRRVYRAKGMRLAKLAEDGVERFDYNYDFGDDWRHRVVIEAVRAAEPGMLYPQFLGGERRCPPEDVGGMPGYYEFLDAIAKPKSKAGRDALDWYGQAYDPDDIDEEQITISLRRIARRRRTGKRAG